MIEKPYLALIATITIWSSAYIAIRVGMQEYHAGSFALLRLCVGTICMIIICLKNPPKAPIAKRDMFYGLLLGAIGMGVYHIFLNFGEQTVTAGIASFIIALAPLFTTVFSAIFLKEKVYKLGWIGLAISALGMVLIALGEVNNAKFDVGIICILISAVCSSIYLTAAKHLLTKISGLYLTVFMLLGGTLTTIMFLPQLVSDLPKALPKATYAGIYLGIFPTSLAYLTYNYALAKIPRSTAVSWLYALPLMTIFMGWLLLGELPTSIAFIGGLVALSGMVLVNMQKIGLKFKTA